MYSPRPAHRARRTLSKALTQTNKIFDRALPIHSISRDYRRSPCHAGLLTEICRSVCKSPRDRLKKPCCFASLTRTSRLQSGINRDQRCDRGRASHKRLVHAITRLRSLVGKTSCCGHSSRHTAHPSTYCDCLGFRWLPVRFPDNIHFVMELRRLSLGRLS
jgi:hypothetical protein